MGSRVSQLNPPHCNLTSVLGWGLVTEVLAKLYFSIADARHAKKELSIAMSQGADDANVHSLEGDIKALDGDFAGALKDYEDALRMAGPGADLPNLNQMVYVLRSYVTFKPPDPKGLKHPTALSAPHLNYTAAARENNIVGHIKLNVLIDETGKVRGVLQLSRLGYGLDEEAVTAVEAMQFSPAQSDGRPIPYWQAIVVDFSMTIDWKPPAAARPPL